jgi:hypothetical protein
MRLRVAGVRVHPLHRDAAAHAGGHAADVAAEVGEVDVRLGRHGRLLAVIAAEGVLDRDDGLVDAQAARDLVGR